MTRYEKYKDNVKPTPVRNPSAKETRNVAKKVKNKKIAKANHTSNEKTNRPINIILLKNPIINCSPLL